MDKLIFNPGATLREQAVVRQGLVHELSNVATVGFKRSFQVALRSLKFERDGFDTRYQAQANYNDRIDLKPGALMATGRPLDVAMLGNTVLAVQAADGQQAFTRRGDLRVSAAGQLETGAGHAVLGEAGPLSVPAGFDVLVTSDGQVFARDPGQVGVATDTPVGRLRLRDATDSALSRREDGLFQAAGRTPGTDLPPASGMALLQPRALEGSNVGAIDAMTRMIDHARSFEAQIRVIKEMKDLDASGASMMKLG
jgi:flagellar basal-body rod protein FlgF